ncbi:carbon starvation protein A [Shewanella inventionis]|uniref:Carbon starvation protein A n=1 Tax=Shewanella inventionis TaxID=1738770 RepID=A0ABQ1IXV2_9GAMM|nr:carbon starvation protein A [Shewanella inventionis]MCL1157108.1 carbon starvation protein A [Shewanella inventionis]UAL44472.1 carbon starvation protein A [Shewanella inventionis]GGB55280.1 carbon starvation protein A [Shewanella inventionis]
MLIFLICIALLLLAYKLYSPFVEKQAGIDPNLPTPQTRFNDGVDYVPVHPAKAFLIQFLNVAGVGPIFGPILGALYGPIALVWIVLGNILGGAVHDYFSGVMSIKEDGKSLPEIAGHYFNIYFKAAMLVFTAMLLFFVGVVFIMSPAGLLSNLDYFKDTIFASNTFWVLVILAYYFFATLLPIDKIITKLYPFFGLLMIVMTTSIAVALLINAPQLPEFGDVFAYFDHSHYNNDLLEPNPDGLPVWPLLFVTITCGAISGFHSTQAPIMARCLTNEKYVRPVYYGAMVSEGIVACVWATAGIAAFPGGYVELKEILALGGPGMVVNQVATTYLGVAGGIMAIIAVAVFPITSGDTAFRSLRLTIIDAFKIPQSMTNRLLVAVPVLIIAYFMTKIDFTLIWRYFAFSNMLLSTSVLWLATKYLFDRGTIHWIVSIPAIIGTCVTVSYIMTAGIGFGLPQELSQPVGVAVGVVAFIGLLIAHNKRKAAPAA